MKACYTGFGFEAGMGIDNGANRVGLSPVKMGF